MLKGNFVLIKAKPKTNKSLSEAVAGDLLCYNNDKLYIYPSSKFEGTPIGVVVIPTSDNVYSNGSCGVMSLVNMSYLTPDTGTTNEEEISWGGCGYGPYEGLHDITLVNGAINTEILLSKSTYQPNWRTDEVIKNVSGGTSEASTPFPAACCCWRFHTVGTKQGDWYLPSVIELNRVNTVLTELQNTSEAIPDQFKLLRLFHWSCIGGIEKDIAYNVWLGKENGGERSYNAAAPLCVKAFMQAGPDIVAE